jgi:hypothetical protein
VACAAGCCAVKDRTLPGCHPRGPALTPALACTTLLLLLVVVLLEVARCSRTLLLLLLLLGA